VFIVAGPDARPDFLAADLLAQAEHDELASVVLATPSAALAEAVRAEIERQLPALSRETTARKSLAARSMLVVTRGLPEACELANRYGAEHLQLCVEDPDAWLPLIECAGAVFLGAYSPVPIGDYAAGPSHVLPTGGTARFFSGIGVEDFQHRISLIDLSESAFGRIAPAATRLARLEGLDAHARALEIRLRQAKR
jgi:histidinol dehydrogenase